MKKIICIILSLLTLLTLVSCQPTTPPEESSSPESSPEATPAPSEASTPEESESEYEPEPETPYIEISSLEINGIGISEYTIVYPKKNADTYVPIAQKLADHIETEFTRTIPIEASQDSEAEKVIVIGACNEYITSKFKQQAQELENYEVDTATASIVRIGNIVWISGTNTYTLEAGVDKLIADSTPEKAGDKIDLDYSGENAVSVVAESLGEVLKVMTYNVQTGTPDRARQNAMIKNITDFMPDVIGTQEVNYGWINIFKLTGLLKEYEFVGKPRGKEGDTSNGNEYSSILFRKSKFNLLDSGTCWLSETPDIVNSKLDSSEYTRIMTYVVLERKSDGARFVHVNTHMSWDAKGDKTNLKQMKIILKLVDERIYAKYGELPTYFTGDFNVTMASEGYKHLLSTGKVDSRTVADVSSKENTFPGSIIDYCIVTEGDFKVASFDVGFELPGSDHYPVYVEMYLTPQK